MGLLKSSIPRWKISLSGQLPHPFVELPHVTSPIARPRQWFTDKDTQSIADRVANRFSKRGSIVVPLGGKLRHSDATPKRYSRNRLTTAVRCRENNRQHPRPDSEQRCRFLSILRKEQRLRKERERYQTNVRQ
jgi:hypothetical protein